MQKVAIQVKGAIGEIDLIVTSPYLRATQTANILAAFWGKVRIVEAPELVPSSPPEAFVQWLKAHGRNLRSVVVVGHEPQLGLLASYLLAGVNESFMTFKKSGIARLKTGTFSSLGPACSTLEMLLPPKQSS